MNVQKLQEALQQICDEQLMDSDGLIGSLMNLNHIPDCLETLQGKQILEELKRQRNSVNPKNNTFNSISKPQKNSQKQEKNNAPKNNTLNSSSKLQENSEKQETNKPNFLSNLFGKKKNSEKAEEPDKNDEETEKKDEETDDKDKIVYGVEELFKSKINKKWFKKQQDFFLKSKDHNGVKIEKLLKELLDKNISENINIEDIKKYIYIYIISFYSEINNFNKENIIENITVFILNYIFGDDTEKSKENTPTNSSKKINDDFFKQLLENIQMYSYPIEGLKLLNKKNKAEAKNNAAIKAKEAKNEAKEAKKGGGIFGFNFWENDKKDPNILVIDTPNIKIDKEKFNKFNSTFIAENIINFLNNDEIIKIIDEEKYINFAINTRKISNLTKNIEKSSQLNVPNNNISKPNSNRSGGWIKLKKGGVNKDLFFSLSDDLKKNFIKIILQGIKYMFEQSISADGIKQGEHKLDPFIEDIINKSFIQLIEEIPLYDENKKNETNIKIDKDSLKNAFKCLISEIITKSKDFPLKPKINLEKYKEKILNNEKGKTEKVEKFYLVYNVLRSKIIHSLKSCKIIIPTNLTENELIQKIQEYSDDKINAFNQDLIKSLGKYKNKLIFNKTDHSVKLDEQNKNNVNVNEIKFDEQNKNNINELNIIYKMLQTLQNNIGNNEKSETPEELKKSTLNGGGKKFIFILGRKRILIKRGRANFVKYKNNYITLTEAKYIEKRLKSIIKKNH